MNDTTGGRRAARLAGALAAGAAMTGLVAGCAVHTSTSYQAGPVGSASYRQVLSYIQCLRSHGGPDLPTPGPGDSVTIQASAKPSPGQTISPDARAISACQHLLPPPQKHRGLHITIG